MGNITKLSLVAACLWLANCSEVDFTPYDPNNIYQGNGEYKEKFVISQDDSQNKVDILFVVDNSTSMREEQEKLGQRLNSFLGQLNDVDWQIGITTTDVSDGPFGIKGSLIPFLDDDNSTKVTQQKGSSFNSQGNKKILNKRSPNFAQSFLKTVVRKETNNCTTCPSPDEQPLRASIMAVQKRLSTNLGFFRPGVDTAIVVLSDEDELSNTPAHATKPEEVINAYKNEFGSAHHLSVFGIIIQPGDNKCYDDNWQGGGNFGTFVARLAQLTGGVTGSICDNNYGQSLRNIGKRVRELIQSISLINVPDPETVKITVTPSIEGLEWTIDGNKIRFSKGPPTGTQIEVTYKLPQ